MTTFGKLNLDGTFSYVRDIDQSNMLKCPHCIMVPEHYREDQSCRCNDETHTEMESWGYIWDGLKWIAGDE